MPPKKSTQKKTAVAAIIPAAGRPSNRIMQHSALPDTMLPINGKPVIGYILEDLLSRGIVTAAVALNPDDSYTQRYIEQKFSDRLNLHIIRTPADRGVGHSIYRAALVLKNQQSILVYLGDTIYKGALDFTASFLITSKNYEDPQKWCFIETKSGRLPVFVNKPLEHPGQGVVLSGLYFFKNGRAFTKAAALAEAKFKKIEVSNILDYYQRKERFKLIPANRWYDCGNIENYYAAKIDFLRVRSFNRLSYNPTLGVITKSSHNAEKLNQEINWYLKAPDELKIFAPRLYDYKIGKRFSSYSVEYYGYQTLADINIFAHLNPSIWRSIIKRLFEIISVFKTYPAALPLSYFADMYVNKPHRRLDELLKDPYWKKILGREEIIINGVAYKNFPTFFGDLEKMAKALYRKKDMAFIHGDLCLSNILYDIDSRLIKLVDPRGFFGKMSVYGDIKYDLAKLRHSFCGHYDFIVSDLFKVQEPSDGQFSFWVYTEDYHNQIAQEFDSVLKQHGYDLAQIKYIEALLFLSMLPLHKNNINRQRAMYLSGIKLINEVLSL